MARAIEQLKQAMEACELGALTLPDQIDSLMDAGKAILQEVSTLTPQNEPLTLDELRAWRGPVWVKVFGPTDIRCDGWCEVEVRDKNTSDEIAYVWWAGSEVEDIGRTEDYGKTWITYRHLPEKEEDNTDGD